MSGETADKLRGGDPLTIGELARRTGLAVSAIRFYESKGLVSSIRSEGNQRRFLRSDIRRLSVVQIAQQLGFTIQEIKAALAGLPVNRAPTQKDWERISRDFRSQLDQRISRLTRLRDYLDGCIGCGCLSMKKCALINPGDRMKKFGPGPRVVMGDSFKVT
jgi:MerR family redox-sensitive transcriptional activator SoxR